MTSFPPEPMAIPGQVKPAFTADMKSRKVGFYVADPTGHILEANDEFLLMIGSTSEELAQGRLACRDIMGEYAWLSLEKMLDVLDHQGYIGPFELNFCSREGSGFSGLLSITAFRDGSGRGAYLVQNITRLKQSKGILEGILQETSDMIAAVDMQFRYIAFNQAYQLEMKNLYGLEFEVGDRIIDVLASLPQEQARVVEGFTHAFRGEKFTHCFEAGDVNNEWNDYEVTYGAIEDNGLLIGAFHVARNKTKQRQLEEEQRQAQPEIIRLNDEMTKRFDNTFEQAAVGLAHVGDQGEFLRINQKYCEILGYSREEISGLHFAELTHPEDRARDVALHRKLFTGELNEFYHDKRYIQKDGSIIWVHLTVAAVKNVQGKTEYNMVVVEDITERMQVEAALRESEERFRIMANASPAQIYDVAPNGQLRFINKTIIDFYGPEKEQEILDGGWINYVHPDDRESLAQPIPSAHEVPSFSACEFRIQRKGGEYRWFLASTAPSFYPNGEMYGLVGTAIDITERKQMEESLQQSKARWEELANAVPLAIWVANRYGELLFVNERWYEYSGLTPEQSLGTAGVDAIHPDDRESVVRLWVEYFQQGKLFEIEVRYRNAAGSSRWHLVRAVPVKDTDGVVLNWYGTSLDIQDRRMMEQDLAKARDIAEDVSRKKSQFLANMSHELRTPLNAVIGFSDMLNKGMAGVLTEKQSGYVAHIATSGRHLLAMVNDILNISKAEAGHIDILLQYVTLEPFQELRSQ